MKEVNNFQMNQDLKIVYEQSEEESIRRNTMRSEGDEEVLVESEYFNMEYENLVKMLRQQM